MNLNQHWSPRQSHGLFAKSAIQAPAAPEPVSLNQWLRCSQSQQAVVETWAPLGQKAELSTSLGSKFPIARTGLIRHPRRRMLRVMVGGNPDTVRQSRRHLRQAGHEGIPAKCWVEAFRLRGSWLALGGGVWFQDSHGPVYTIA